MIAAVTVPSLLCMTTGDALTVERNGHSIEVRCTRNASLASPRQFRVQCNTCVTVLSDSDVPTTIARVASHLEVVQ